MARRFLNIESLFGRRSRMARKCVVKVGLSREQKDISLELVRRFGTSESEMLRTALMDYAKDAYLVRERMYRKQVAMVEN